MTRYLEPQDPLARFLESVAGEESDPRWLCWSDGAASIRIPTAMKDLHDSSHRRQSVQRTACMTRLDEAAVVEMLRGIEAGDAEARARLIAALQPELRACADRLMRGQPTGHTLQPTALVNEAYLKLFADDGPCFGNRRHLMVAAATAMRRILIDHARGKSTFKRQPDGERLALDSVLLSYEDTGIDLLATDEALSGLAEFDAEMARVAELRIFVGLPLDEISVLEGIPLRTLERRWSVARAWMMGRML